MPGPVQLQGGSYSWSIAFTGLQNELVVDESNRDLILHDGVTVGGYRFRNAANSDARYQARSPELDGLLGFEPQDRGFLVRRAPADYRVREIKVNDQNLTIVNPLGYAGNPTFSLKATISSEHTWSERQTFVGGITGDLDGDTTGTHTGPVFGNLEGNTSGSHTGPVDVRGSALLLDAGQIRLAALNADAKIFLMPIGGIIMWSGAANAIPNGWFLCNGANGTPDLTDVFVIGAGGAYNVGDSGGAVSHDLDLTIGGGAHNHGVTVADTVLSIAQIPAHNHGSGINPDNVGNPYPTGSSLAPGTPVQKAAGSTNPTPNTTTIGGGLGHNHATAVANDGSHTHTINDGAVEVMPPYYALCYIMKGA